MAVLVIVLALLLADLPSTPRVVDVYLAHQQYGYEVRTTKFGKPYLLNSAELHLRGRGDSYSIAASIANSLGAPCISVGWYKDGNNVVMHAWSTYKNQIIDTITISAADDPHYFEKQCFTFKQLKSIIEG